MRFIVSLALIALLSFAACIYFPWWSVAVIAFLVAVIIPQNAGTSFLTGFIALFLLWGVLSFWISSSNDDLLAHRISLLILKIDSPYLLMAVTALIGGLVAGFAALSGSYLRRKKAVGPAY